jgi:hypothetical protein
MKKKTLTEEINRMLILMESPANKWVTAAEGLVKVLKEIPGLSNFIINSIDGLSRARNSEEVIGLLNSLAKASPLLRDDILKTVYKELNPVVKDVVSDAIEQIKTGSIYRDSNNTSKDISDTVLDGYFNQTFTIIKSFKFIDKQ